VIVTFDLSWDGVVGWAAIGQQILTGHAKGYSAKRGDAPETLGIKRAMGIHQIVTNVLNTHKPEIIGYEDTFWALGAKRSLPQKVGACAPVVTCWLAIGQWCIKCNQQPQVVSISTKKARSDMGVKQCASLKPSLLKQVLALPGYENETKAEVGVTVALLMEQAGHGLLIPPTDHQADALLYALWLERQCKLR